MNSLLVLVHVDGLVRNCLLLFILVDAGGVGSGGHFVFWKYEVAQFDGLVDIWFCYLL